jgi:hypothetical protein
MDTITIEASDVERGTILFSITCAGRTNTAKLQGQQSLDFAHAVARAYTMALQDVLPPECQQLGAQLLQIVDQQKGSS